MAERVGSGTRERENGVRIPAETNFFSRTRKKKILCKFGSQRFYSVSLTRFLNSIPRRASPSPLLPSPLLSRPDESRSHPLAHAIGYALPGVRDWMAERLRSGTRERESGVRVPAETNFFSRTRKKNYFVNVFLDNSITYPTRLLNSIPLRTSPPSPSPSPDQTSRSHPLVHPSLYASLSVRDRMAERLRSGTSERESGVRVPRSTIFFSRTRKKLLCKIFSRRQLYRKNKETHRRQSSQPGPSTL